MVRYVVFFVLSGLIVFSITVFFRLGGHKHVDIAVKDIGAYHTLSKKHIGAYHKIGFVIDEVEKWAKDNGVPCERTYGEYLDNPREKDEDRLQSFGGCVTGEDISPELKAKLPQDFLLGQVDAGPRVVAVFKGAPSIGPFKVYPAVEKFMADKHWVAKGSVIEIYSIFGTREASTEYQFKYQTP
jgi:hypothetical protein